MNLWSNLRHRIGGSSPNSGQDNRASNAFGLFNIGRVVNDDNISVTITEPPHRERQSWLAVFLKTMDYLFLPEKKVVYWIGSFRSKIAVYHERDRQRLFNRHIIHPLSFFRKWWDFLVIIVLAFTMVVLPVRTAFYTRESHQNAWMTVNLMIDIILLLDIIVNFRTAYIHKATDEVILENRSIIRHYLRHGFFFDMVSSLPLEYFVLSIWYADDDTVRLSKILRFLKVFRFVRLFRYMEKFQTMVRIEMRIISLTKLICAIVLFIHWNGCLQYFLGYLQGFPADSWVVISRLQDGNSTVSYKYVYSVFRSLSHMVSVGYGHDIPINTLEIWMTVMSCIIGASFYALLIGHMSLLIMRVDYSGRRYMERVSEVKEYMKYRKVPVRLQKQVLEYYEHRYQRHLFDEHILMREENMTDILKGEIFLYTCSNLLKKVDFLANAPREFLVEIVSKLQLKVYFPGDMIAKAGEIGSCMFFIEHGRVNISLPSGEFVKTLYDGQHFGEISLLTDQQRVATVMAEEISDIHVLEKKDFQRVLQAYPSMKEKLQENAAERLLYLADLKQSLKEGHQQAGAGPSKELNIDAAKDVLTEASMDVLTETSKDVLTETSKDVLTEASKDVPTEASKDVPTKASKDVPTEASKDVLTEASMDVTTEASKDVPTAAPLNVTLSLPDEAFEISPNEIIQETRL